MQGLDFDYRGKGGHSRLAHRLGSSRDALPSRHHLAEGTREHLVIPAAHETVGTVVHTVAPRARQAHIARKGIGTQALRHLVVRRQAVARPIVKEDNTVDHLREKGAHVLVITGQFFLGELMLIGIDFVKRLGASGSDYCYHTHK